MDDHLVSQDRGDSRHRIEVLAAVVVNPGEFETRLKAAMELIEEILDYVEDHPEMPVGDSHTLGVLLESCRLLLLAAMADVRSVVISLTQDTPELGE